MCNALKLPRRPKISLCRWIFRSANTPRMSCVTYFMCPYNRRYTKYEPRYNEAVIEFVAALHIQWLVQKGKWRYNPGVRSQWATETRLIGRLFSHWLDPIRTHARDLIEKTHWALRELTTRKITGKQVDIWLFGITAKCVTIAAGVVTRLHAERITLVSRYSNPD